MFSTKSRSRFRPQVRKDKENHLFHFFVQVNYKNNINTATASMKHSVRYFYLVRAPLRSLWVVPGRVPLPGGPVPDLPPVRRPLPGVPYHVPQAEGALREGGDGRGALEAVLLRVGLREDARPGVGQVLALGGEVVAPREQAVLLAGSGKRKGK